MRPPLPHDSILQAPALPGFVVLGALRWRGSTCSAYAGRSAADRPECSSHTFERVQMGTPVSACADARSPSPLRDSLVDPKPNRSPRDWGASRAERPLLLFERVQMSAHLLGAWLNAQPVLRQEHSFERVQMVRGASGRRRLGGNRLRIFFLPRGGMPMHRAK